MTMLLGYLLGASLVTLVTSRSGLFIYQEEMQDNVYPIGVIAEIRANGMMECGAQCQSFAGGNCTIASYNSETRMCRLYNDQLEKNNPEKEQGWEAWSLSIRGCGPPPIVPHADIISGGGFLDVVTNYMCKSDFKSCGLQTESRCLVNGEWTAITGLCSQYRWHYPVIPFWESLPCQDQTMMHIRIKATPTAEAWMTFELPLDNDRLLIMSIRFPGGGKLVLNTFIGGIYGAEVEPSGFPFTVNELFTMEITLSSGIYQIMVGDQTWTFTERSSGVTPNQLIAHGALKIELIEIL